MLSCEYCENFMSNFFIEHLRWMLLWMLLQSSKPWTKYLKYCWSRSVWKLEQNVRPKKFEQPHVQPKHHLILDQNYRSKSHIQQKDIFEKNELSAKIKNSSPKNYSLNICWDIKLPCSMVLFVSMYKFLLTLKVNIFTQKFYYDEFEPGSSFRHFERFFPSLLHNHSQYQTFTLNSFNN